MSEETKLIKGLFTKLDSDLFSIEEEVFLAIEAKEARITELENALLEAADILEGCAEFELNYTGEKCRETAKGGK